MVKVCKEGSTLNTVTGRCNKNCSILQEKSPATGRCRKLCTDKQVRNPDTGRCKISKVPKVPKEKKIKVPKEVKVPKIDTKPITALQAAIKRKLAINAKIDTKPITALQAAIKRKLAINAKIDTKPITALQAAIKRKLAKQPEPLPVPAPIALIQKNKLKTPSSLDERITLYKFILNKMKDINEESCLNYVKGKKNQYTFENMLNITPLLASRQGDNKIGTTYEATFYGNTEPDMIAKIYPINEFEKKSRIDIVISNISKRFLTRHILLKYGSYKCNKDNDKFNKVKNLVFEEKTEGTLKKFMTRQVLDNKELLSNIILQLFITVITFHNLYGSSASFPNDLLSSFYYIKDDYKQENNITGLYKYDLDDRTTYYIKSSEICVIADIQKSKKRDLFTAPKPKIFLDIINNIHNHMIIEYNLNRNQTNLPETVKMVLRIKEYLESITKGRDYLHREIMTAVFYMTKTNEYKYLDDDRKYKHLGRFQMRDIGKDLVMRKGIVF